MAEWLNTAFYGFDNLIFNGAHGLAQVAGAFFTPFFTFITFFGEKGLFFVFLSLILMLFAKTRKLGLTMLVAIGVGALLTNVILKNAVARQRPYVQSQVYADFHKFVGARLESDLSFPSGHTTVTMTSMTALFLLCNKKWSWVGFIFALLMGLSRIYLIVHYPTDVVAALIVGLGSGVAAYFIVKGVYKIIENKRQVKFCYHFLNFDLIKVFKKK